jgi:hypothetical protein
VSDITITSLITQTGGGNGGAGGGGSGSVNVNDNAVVAGLQLNWIQRR